MKKTYLDAHTTQKRVVVHQWENRWCCVMSANIQTIVRLLMNQKSKTIPTKRKNLLRMHYRQKLTLITEGLDQSREGGNYDRRRQKDCG